MTTLPVLKLTEARGFKLTTWLLTSLELMPDQAIETIAANEGLTVEGICPDVLFAKEAWPHTDPNWDGKVFYTMTVEGGEYQFGSLSQPAGRAVPVGEVFKVRPMELHWLRPDPIVSTGWIGLQWVVPAVSAAQFELALARAISQWNQPDVQLPQLLPVN